jgi:hypothetical protein
VRRLLLLLVAFALGACSGGAPAASAPVSTGAATSTAGELPSGTPAPTSPPLSSAGGSAAPAPGGVTPAPSVSYKAGSWPPEWQRWICSARAQMLREDAKAGGHAGEDAATQAIADLKKTTINWEPGADFRAFLGKAAFILLDAAPRPGSAMDDVPPAIKTFEMAYEELKASTGFECPA